MQDFKSQSRSWSFHTMKPIAMLAVCSLGALAAGCTARVHTARVVAVDDEDVVTDAPPADPTIYEQTEYRGRVVYYVNGRWGYPRGSHWYYYRRQPPELVRHRAYVQEAPPAHYAPTGRPGEAVRVR